MSREEHSTKDLIFYREIDCCLEPGVGHKASFAISKEYLTDKTILDIGCWSGIYINLIKEVGSKMVVGIDIKSEALNVAKETIPDSKFVQSSVFCLPFKKDSFDIVTLWHTIEHLPRNTEVKALGEINRVLKNNGKLFLATPYNHILSKILDPAYFLTGHRHYSKKKLEDLLVTGKFRIEDHYLKGGIFSCFSVTMFYVFKYLFRKHCRLRILKELVEKEYARDSGGFEVIYLIARKTS